MVVAKFTEANFVCRRLFCFCGIEKRKGKKSVDDGGKSRKILCLHPKFVCMNEYIFIFIYILIQNVPKTFISQSYISVIQYMVKHLKKHNEMHLQK